MFLLLLSAHEIVSLFFFPLRSLFPHEHVHSPPYFVQLSGCASEARKTNIGEAVERKLSLLTSFHACVLRGRENTQRLLT